MHCRDLLRVHKLSVMLSVHKLSVKLRVHELSVELRVHTCSTRLTTELEQWFFAQVHASAKHTGSYIYLHETDSYVRNFVALLTVDSKISWCTFYAHAPNMVAGKVAVFSLQCMFTRPTRSCTSHCQDVNPGLALESNSGFACQQLALRK